MVCALTQLWSASRLHSLFGFLVDSEWSALLRTPSRNGVPTLSSAPFLRAEIAAEEAPLQIKT
jgi:hypothetical protein